MKISIAMATYNGAAYVSEQLASFASQSRLPDELIVTDDCSSDATCSIIRGFAATAPFPVRLEINSENLGFTRNFNRALSLTTGDLVFLSDQDDVWFEEKLARMVEFADTRPDAACFMNDALLADERLVPSGITKLQNIRTHGLPDTAFVMGCCTAVKRELLNLVLPIPMSTPSHDNWIVGVSDRLGITRRFDEPLQFYRLHGRNASKFFVNEATRPGPRTRFRQRVGHFAARFSSRDGMLGEYELNRSILARLSERHANCAGLVGIEGAKTAISSLGDRVAILEERRRIRCLPSVARPYAVWSLWRIGGYQEAGNVAGALKDILLAVENCGH